MTKLEERLSYLFDLTDYAAKDIAAELEEMVRKQIVSEINVSFMAQNYINEVGIMSYTDAYLKGIEDTLKAIGGK